MSSARAAGRRRTASPSASVATCGLSGNLATPRAAAFAAESRPHKRDPVMGQEEPGSGGPLGPIELRKLVPFEPCATSDPLGWAGLAAARYREAPASEISVPPLSHHTLVLITRPPEELELRYEGVKRHFPPPAGSTLVVPAGS